MGDDNWSVRRLANRAGIAESSVRRYIAELETAGIFVTEWPLDKAVIAVRAYRDGHNSKAIALLGDQPYLGSTMWLVSREDPKGVSKMFSTLLQATAFIEQNPFGTYHLSPIGNMGQEAVA